MSLLSLFKPQSTINYEVLKAVQKDLEHKIYDLYPRKQVNGHPDVYIFDTCGYLELSVNIEEEQRLSVKLTGDVGLISVLISIANSEDTIIDYHQMLEIAELITENISGGVVQVVINNLNVPMVYLHSPVMAKNLNFDYLVNHVKQVKSECASDRMTQVTSDYIKNMRMMQAVDAEFDELGDDYQDPSLAN